LDVVATLNNDIQLNIEMQVKDYYNTVERSLFYLTGMYHESLEIGEDYIETPQTISIWITTYDVFEDGPFYEVGRLKRDYENKVITNSFELHYIQLSKFKEQCKKISSKLDEWLTFIINENQEEIHMIKNEKIKKAEKELEYLTGDEETRRLAELREKAIRDERAALKKAKREGYEDGQKAGNKASREEVAKKMLKNKIDINIIMECTNLTKEEIEKLK
jgi:predicted transposase/invertase (TIGR01784 family)